MITQTELESIGWNLEKKDLNTKYSIGYQTQVKDLYKKDNYWLTVSMSDDRQLVSIIPVDPSKAEFYEQRRLITTIDSIKDLKTILKIMKLEIERDFLGNINIGR